MSVQMVGASKGYYAVKSTAEEPQKKAETGAAATAEQAAKKEDGFAASTSGEPVTYSKPSRVTANQLQAMQQQRVDSFTRMLQSMVAKQGQKSNLQLFGIPLHVTPEDSAAAAKAIAPGGEYSVDAVAGRILDMAKALSGGDESKISILREAVQKGFKAAGVDLGGKLPSICNDTYDKVMKDFDEWEQSFRTTATEE